MKSPEVKQGKIKKPWSLGKQIAIGAAALAITAAGVGGVIEGPKLLRGNGQTEPIGTLLDPSSFAPVTASEEQNILKNTQTVDLNSHTFIMAWPFDQATIDRNPNIRMSQEFGIRSGVLAVQELEKQGVKNVTIITGLSKGDQYKLIYDESKYDASITTIEIAGVRVGEGAGSYMPAYTSLRIMLRDKITGETSEESESISGLLAKSLIDFKAPAVGHNAIYEDGVPAKSGSPILELTTNLQDWNGDKSLLPDGEKGQFVIRTGTRQKDPNLTFIGIPLTADFLKTPDGHIAVRNDGAIDYGNGVIGPTPADVQRANSGK